MMKMTEDTATPTDQDDLTPEQEREIEKIMQLPEIRAYLGNDDPYDTDPRTPQKTPKT